MHLKKVIAMLAIGMMAWAFPCAAQRGHGSGANSSSPMYIPHTGANAGNNYKDYIYGVIKEVSLDGIVLTKTKAGADQAFKLSKKTKFLEDGKDASLKDFKAGDQVWVAADQDKKTGDLIARKVITGVFIMPSQ